MITAIPGMVQILRSSGLAVQAITGSDNTAKPQFAKAPGRYNSGFYTVAGIIMPQVLKSPVMSLYEGLLEPLALRWSNL